MQAQHANLPLPSFTRRMAIELAKNVVMFLNAYPPKSGLSKTYSPCTIMTGKALDWKKSCKLHFGDYAQVHENRNVTNALEEGTQGAICLGPTGNLHGTYNFFSLQSEKKTRGQFTEVPTPTIVMKRVATMALSKKQNEGLIFENHTGATVNDLLPYDKVNESFHKIDGNITGVEWDPETEIQETYSPRTIMTGNALDWKNSRKLHFGAYA